MNTKLIKVLGVCILPFFVFVLFFFLADGFGFHTIPIILSQSMIPTVLGLAMACIMPAGLMDFSPGARMLLGAILGGVLTGRLGVAGLVIGAFIGAMLGGVVIAMLYRYLQIPSMVVSLGVVLVMEAFSDRLAIVIGGSSMVKISGEIAAIGNYPKNIIITLLACIFFFYISYKTKLGCLITATGNDEAMLKSMGVDVNRVKFKAFLLSGVFCFAAAVMQICYSGMVQAVTDMGTMTMVFKPMMGVLIAMQLIKLYDNMPLMILIGEIVIQTVFNGFIAMGWTDNIQNIVLGVFLILVLGLSENMGRITEFRRKLILRKNMAQV
ncbi:MAG: ABC transporter permease [Lachnospiraceae bacterium]